jgi:hypothetical protein
VHQHPNPRIRCRRQIRITGITRMSASAHRHECESGIARTRSDQPFGWARADAGIGWNAAQIGGSGACPAEHVPAERNDLCTPDRSASLCCREAHRG